jgi:glycosyltransferase involved in cell wall biosynthesis
MYLDAIVGARNWQFVLVDNGSTDQTPKIIHEILPAFPPSKMVHVPEPNYGAALRAGIRIADTKFLHTCDVEQWDIPFLNWAWSERENHDLLIGSKRSDPTISQQTPRRRFLSWGLNALLQLFFGYMGTDTHGPKLINLARLRPVIESSISDRGQFDTEIVLRAVRKGHRIAEAPIAFSETRPPRTKIFKKVVWNLVAFNRLRRIIRNVEYEGPVEFRQFTRSDVLVVAEAATAQRMDKGREATRRTAALAG